MPEIILDGASIVQSTANGHIQTERYIQTGTGGGYCNSWDEYGNCTGYAPTYPIYNWVGGYSVPARINGTVKAKATQVYVQGKNPVLQNDKTTETDTYTLGSNERYRSGAHTNASGTVTGGNTKNVYIGGTLVSIKGASVTTHASTSTTINSGTSSTVYIGG